MLPLLIYELAHIARPGLHTTKIKLTPIGLCGQDVAEVLAKEYKGKINVAYEGVGGDLRTAILDNMAEGGRMLAVGYISGYPHNADYREPSNEADGELPPDHILMWKGMTVKHKGKTIYGSVWSGVRTPIFPYQTSTLFSQAPRWAIVISSNQPCVLLLSADFPCHDDDAHDTHPHGHHCLYPL
jgi:hypothetical protein